MNKFLSLFLCVTFAVFLQAQSALTFTIHRLSPSPDITCINPSVKFIVNSDNYENVSYAWLGPSVNYNGQNADITAPGVYTVIATLSSAQSTQQTLTIGVNTIMPVVSISPNIQSMSCANNLTTSVYATASSTNVSHHFISPSGGTSVMDGTAISYSVGGPGTYTHVAIDRFSGCSVTSTFIINSASGFPSFSLLSASNFSLGCETKSLVAVTVASAVTSPTGSPISYTLLNSPSNLVVGSGTLNASTNFSLNTHGDYLLVTRDNSTGCESRTPFTIVKNNSAPDLTVIIPTQTLNCRRSVIQLSSHSTKPDVDFNWSFSGNAFSGSAISVNSNTNQPLTEFLGNYRLICKDNDNNCQSDTVIPIFQNIHKPLAQIGLSNVNSLSCKQPTVMLSNQSISGIPFNSLFSNTIPIRTLLWMGSSLQLPAVNSNSYMVYSPGIYTMQIIDDNNGCKSSDTVIVFDAKVYPVVNNPWGPKPFCINSLDTSVSVYPIITGPVNSYTFQWTAPAGANINGVNSMTLTANALGIYSIAVTNTISGCSTLGQVIIASCITGISENSRSENSFLIYPNPSSGEFTLSLDGLRGNNQLKIYNTFGQLMQTEDLISEKQSINMNDLPDGMYILSITGDSINMGALKILKQ